MDLVNLNCQESSGWQNYLKEWIISQLWRHEEIRIPPVILSPIQIYNNGGQNERNLLKCIFYHLDPEFIQLLIRKNTMWPSEFFEKIFFVVVEGVTKWADLTVYDKYGILIPVLSIIYYEVLKFPKGGNKVSMWQRQITNNKRPFKVEVINF